MRMVKDENYEEFLDHINQGITDLKDKAYLKNGMVFLLQHATCNKLGTVEAEHIVEGWWKAKAA